MFNAAVVRSPSPSCVESAEVRSLAAPLLPVVGGDLIVPLVDGTSVRNANLDYAASAPSLRSVADAVDALLPWYSSVHRGAGFASGVCTELLAGARESIARFFGARDDDAVVFTRNTTEALNLLATALPDDVSVVSFASEHHANLLPWRRLGRDRHVLLPTPSSADEAIALADRALESARTRHKLLTVTGASNVTGEVWPIGALARVAHRHGARIAIDAAQLAPHRAIDIATLDVDYIALSGHKLYAPFGAGALIGRRDWLDEATPWLAGGGSVRRVTVEDTSWAEGSARHEAGTPNLLGAVALGAACRALEDAGMDRVAAHEARLLDRARRGLHGLSRVRELACWGEASPRIGVVTLTIDGLHHGLVAAALSAEFGIAVRDGSFCAHPLMDVLLGAGPSGSPAGAVRASFGVGTRDEDVDRFVAAIGELAKQGPRTRYRFEQGRHVPDCDPRSRPSLHPLLVRARDAAAASPCASAR